MIINELMVALIDSKDYENLKRLALQPSAQLQPADKLALNHAARTKDLAAIAILIPVQQNLSENGTTALMEAVINSCPLDIIQPLLC